MPYQCPSCWRQNNSFHFPKGAYIIRCMLPGYRKPGTGLTTSKASIPPRLVFMMKADEWKVGFISERWAKGRLERFILSLIAQSRSVAEPHYSIALFSSSSGFVLGDIIRGLFTTPLRTGLRFRCAWQRPRARLWPT